MRGEHTPGPWANSLPSTGFSTIYGGDGKLVFGLAAGSVEEKRPDDECEANARLIAAAPTMADALNYVADNTYCGADAEWHFKPSYDPQVALDAIARALGQGGEEE